MLNNFSHYDAFRSMSSARSDLAMMLSDYAFIDLGTIIHKTITEDRGVRVDICSSRPFGNMHVTYQDVELLSIGNNSAGILIDTALQDNVLVFSPLMHMDTIANGGIIGSSRLYSQAGMKALQISSPVVWQSLIHVLSDGSVALETPENWLRFNSDGSVEFGQPEKIRAAWDPEGRLSINLVLNEYTSEHMEDGTWYIYHGPLDEVRLWDSYDGETYWRKRWMYTPIPDDEIEDFSKYEKYMITENWLPDGSYKYLLKNSDDIDIIVKEELPDGSNSYLLSDAEGNPLLSIQQAPDGMNTLLLTDADGNELVKRVQMPDGTLNFLAMDPDGKIVLQADITPDSGLTVNIGDGNFKASVDLDGNTTITTKGTLTEEIEGAWTVTTQDAAKIEAEGTLDLITKDALSIEATGAFSITAKDAFDIEATGALGLTTKDAFKVDATGAASIETKDAFKVDAVGAASIESKDAIKIDAMGNVTIGSKGKVTIEGMTGIEISCLAGVTLKGAVGEAKVM